MHSKVQRTKKITGYSCLLYIQLEPKGSNSKMERTSSPLLHAQATAPVAFLPKGRGRPRASYAQTGEFDLGLIREFHSRPALYDRSNKLFKDKVHVAQLWMQISHKLGYDVTLLRERMITLRNRYNIEKRRMENSIQSSSTATNSPWPLFDNLSFLSEHIRSRRSYKMQSKSVDGRQDEDDDDEPFDVDDMNSDSNGHVKNIKRELQGDYDDGNDNSCDQLPVTTVLDLPRITESTTDQHNFNTHLNGNNIVNGQNSHYGPSSPNRPVESSNLKRGHSTVEAERSTTKRQRESASATANATGTVTATYPKFRAFGEFVSHSLTELPHSVAMRLVETFTRELVQASLVREMSKENLDSTNQGSNNEIYD